MKSIKIIGDTPMIKLIMNLIIRENTYMLN